MIVAWLNYIDSQPFGDETGNGNRAKWGDISDPAQLLVSKLRSYFAEPDAMNAAAVQNLVDSIIRLQKNLEPGKANAREKARIILECALSECRIGEKTRAVSMAKDALAQFDANGDTIYVATTLFLLGYLANSLNNAEQALVYWRDSHTEFKAIFLACDETQHAPYRRWIGLRLGDIDAIEKETVNRISEVRKPVPTPTVQPSSTVPASRDRLVLDKPDRAQAETNLAQTGFAEETLAAVEIEHVVIQNQRHRIVNLRAESPAVLLQAAGRLITIRVESDSMNQARNHHKVGIDPGDYVLLRVQSTADYGDIVAVQVFHEGNTAALRYIYTSPDGVVLEPSSSNRAHQAYHFMPGDPGFEIRGVAVALFKPDPEATSSR